MSGRLSWLCAVGLCLGLSSLAGGSEELRTRAQRLMGDGMYKDALDIYQQLALDPKSSGLDAGEDVMQAIQCLKQLNRVSEIDALRDQAIELRQNDWKALIPLAETFFGYSGITNYGNMVDGKFIRGQRSGGYFTDAYLRDRIRGLRLFDQSLRLTPASISDADKSAAGRLYASFSQSIAGNNESWRLTGLTDLAGDLPDYDSTGQGRGYHASLGAPVDADGNPIFHKMPTSWDKAATDGERWRWLMELQSKLGPAWRDNNRFAFANFLRDQFDVQTMARYGVGRGRSNEDDSENQDGPFSVITLKENETIAKLATGVKRFNLPEEFNFIAIYRSLLDGKGARAGDSARELARIFENRRQYPKAAAMWETAGRLGGVSSADAAKSILSITGGWGRLEPIGTVPAGTRAKLGYLFRNGKGVTMTARRLDEKLLWQDIRKYIKRDPKNMGWDKINLSAIGWRVIRDNQSKYVVEKTAEWKVDLDPRSDHLSRRTFVEMPFDKAGVYLVEARMADGNISRTVFWQADLALVEKRLNQGFFYYVADAVTGEPVPDATVSFFKFRYSPSNRSNIRDHIEVRENAEFVDADGGLVVPYDSEGDYSWQKMIQAQAKDGRIAWLDFSSYWGRESSDDYGPDNSSFFVITDRPVYRPEQTMKFKAWLGNSSYDQSDNPKFAGHTCSVRITSPMGEEVYSTVLASDSFGGVSGEFSIGKNLPLGQYYLEIHQEDNYSGGIGFRLEEYRKPEFEVTVDTPDEPLMLGDSAKVKIKAKYYFGSPVSKGKVEYKVTRYVHNKPWFPPAPWDWLYGQGYWWWNYDYGWYPGWRSWGTCAPVMSWMQPWRMPPPELVAQGEGELDADGTFTLPIDTAPAKAFHGDLDHRYEISVDVTDQSRRAISGGGSILATRQPFDVVAWTNRGYYLEGDEIDVSFQARTAEGKGVSGKGDATLYRITYDSDMKPVEKAVQMFKPEVGADGSASVRLSAVQPGQYRISMTVADAKGRSREGAVVFTVRGEGSLGSDFRFSDLELAPDRKEYSVGGTVKLAVNTARENSVVLLFERAANGVAKGRPKVLRLKGKTALAELPVAKRDMPNFFCEALTVSGAKAISEIRQIAVPPETRALTVEVEPDAQTYGPGKKAKYSLRVTDASGAPVHGQCTVTLYDKSVEYISGGSNVGDIKNFFWSWKRSHHPYIRSSLVRYGYMIQLPNELTWMPIGVFGYSEADEEMGQGEFDGGPVMAGAGGAANRMVMRQAAPMAMEAAEMVSDSYAAPMSVAAPAPPPSPEPTGGMVKQDAFTEAPMEGKPESFAETKVRSEFADTAFWTATLETDSEGRASFDVIMPDNLTAWKARVWTMAPGTRVGEGTSEVVTRKNIMIRPQAPRFLTQKDEVTLSAIVHNYLPRTKKVRVSLEMEGGMLAAMPGTELTRNVEVESGGEKRIDWTVKAKLPGAAVIRMHALTDEESDAAEQKVPVSVRGIRRVETFSGAIRDGQSVGTIRFRVPEERLPDQSRLEVRFSPTLATAMVDALPYLIEYPYGCTEQTLNRFLPAVLTRRLLEDLGASLGNAKKDDPNPAAAQWRERFGDWRKSRKNSAVFDDAELDKIVKEGVDRLISMQNSDGGWGWFSGPEERSWPHTTAVVVYGLSRAVDNKVAVVPNVLEQGIEWLQRYQKEQVVDLKKNVADKDKGKSAAGNMDAFVYMTLAQRGIYNADMRDFLYRDRLKLSATGLAMFGLGLDAEKATNALETVTKLLAQYVIQDKENQTAWLNLPNSGWGWYWYNSDIESMAWYLKLLARTDPKGEVAAGVAKYLVNNRKNGSYWRSTRDTAYVLDALAEYSVASGERSADVTVRIFYDGQKVMERKITAADLFADNMFVLDGLAVEAGEHEVKVERVGSGPLYFNASLANFTMEDPIPPAGLEIKVERAWYKLIPVKSEMDVADSSGQAIKQRVEKYERQRIPSPFDKESASSVKSGDLLEVELTIDSKNDYEYIVFEDHKAAGCEPVDVRSGYNGNPVGAYMEFRDNRVVLFVRSLSRGKHSVGYRLRAEAPGVFSALPTLASGMYSPELSANSSEMKITVVDAE